MKKFLMVLLACAFLTTLNVNCEEIEANGGYAVEICGEVQDYTTTVFNNIHYVPLRAVFEELGAAVFYRQSDYQILVLSGNGDEIRHITGSNVITVNGEQIVFVNPTVVENDRTYIPLDMVLSVFYPDEFYCDNGLLKIQKYPGTSEYHKIVKDVLDMRFENNFYPERFQRYVNYHAKMTKYNIQDVIVNVNLGLDYTFYDNVKTIEHPYELLVMVNKYNRLPADFTQYNLVNMDPSYTIRDGKPYLLEAGAYEKYVQMADAAKAEGLNMKVVSAHRTEKYQAGLHSSRARSSGLAYADRYTARAGFSEHQTGLAVDINSTSGTFQYSKEYKWLQLHAHEYGFIMRYPSGKEWITGYSYEPWHYRYVGVDAATIIHDEGITFEEYYAKYISVNEFR